MSVAAVSTFLAILALLTLAGVVVTVVLAAVPGALARARGNYPPSAWFDREGWTAPTLTDDANSSALSALGMGNFPAFVFVDGQGRVVQRLIGEIEVSVFDQFVNGLGE